jgi:hypothetical protein
MNPKRRILAALAVAAACTAVQADDLFFLTGNTTDGGLPVNISQGANSLPNFIRDLIEGSGQFSTLQNRTFQANLRYGAVVNALAFNVNQAGLTGPWNASLVTPFQPGLINRTFTGATRDALYQSIDAYLKSSGSSDLAKFLAAMNKNTVAGALDGNPNAATAQTAHGNFMAYGMLPTSTAQEREDAVDGKAQEGKTGLTMTADAGAFRSQGFSGQTYSWTPMIPFTVGEARRVRLEFSLPLNYTEVQSAAEYRAGLQLGVSVLLVKRTKEQPWLWQVTPHGGAVGDFSQDMVAGGLLANGGLTSYASYRTGPWEFSMGNHFSVHEGVPIKAGDYQIDPDVNQQIVKNGLKVGRTLGRRWYVEAYAIDSEFLQAAFVSRYTTLGAGIGYRRGAGKGYIMVGGYTDFGPNYSSGHLQFGTGWKF